MLEFKEFIDIDTIRQLDLLCSTQLSYQLLIFAFKRLNTALQLVVITTGSRRLHWLVFFRHG
jgi:hypothetical protein